MKFRALRDCYIDGTFRKIGTIFNYTGPQNDNIAPFSDTEDGESADPMTVPIMPRRVRVTSPEDMLRAQMGSMPPVADASPVAPPSMPGPITLPPGAVPSVPPEASGPIAPPLPAPEAPAPAPTALPPAIAALPGIGSVRLPSAMPAPDDLIGMP